MWERLTMNENATINISLFWWGVMTSMLVGCRASELKPVDIYPEDMCSLCRMAVSDQRFVSEIITDQREVFKFDDIGCMENFKEKSNNLHVAVIFLRDYESKNWMLFGRGTIVETDVTTPMGSGKVAFADSARASQFVKLHPAIKPLSSTMECGHDCCSEEKD
jgi:copper chaperone NosL